MNTKLNQRPARKILAASISAIGLMVAAPNLMAQTDGPSEEVLRLIRPDSEISVGVIGVSKNNFKFGDYNGLQKRGTHLDADIRVNKRGEGNANYLDITARNLGLDSRNFEIRGGEQGNYGLSLEYDEIHKLWSDSYQTPYLNPGSDRVTLPAGWVSNCATGAAPGTPVGCGVAGTSASTGLMPNLPGSMRSFNIETQRKSLALGGTKSLSSEWDVSVDYKHETKQGSRLIGAVIGNSGGNPRAAILPEPVDYVTRQFSAIARYTTDALQFQAAYTGSLFDNKKTSLVFQNAYSNGAGTWGAAFGAVGYPNGFGQIGLPPDNQAHQLSASLGYQLSKATRLAGSFSYNRMTQNEAFLPYTVNTGLASPIALPRGSLEGKVNATHLDLKLTSKLNKDLNLLALYRYDDRANKTPQSLYAYIGGDSQNQPAVGAAVDKWRYNLPGSSKKQQIEVEADYRLAAHTKVKLGWGYDWVTKTFEAINSEREHTLKGEVHQHFSDSASGGLSYAWSDRKTSTYDATVPFMAAFTPAFINAAANSPAAGLNWDNNPEQKRFFMAPRTRDKLRAFVNFTPAETIDLHLGVDYKNDNYTTSKYGLQDAKGWGVNADANVKVSDALTAQVFTSWNRYTSLERSNTYGCSAAGAAAGGTKLAVAHPNCDWSATLADHNVTAGIGVRYQPGSEYELGADYMYATSIGKTNMWGGPIAGTITAMPDNSTNLKRLDLFARYELQKNISLNVKYIYERYESRDWQLEGVVSNTLANVIGTNQVAPNYSAHAFGVMVNYRFD